MTDSARSGLNSMIIIAGALWVAPEHRDAYLARDAAVIAHARSIPGCHDFTLTADIVDPGRINVFERWADDETLLRFRNGEFGGGTDRSAQPAILAAEVRKYRISDTEPP
jgi:quinol monooxygenase YgiN